MNSGENVALYKKKNNYTKNLTLIIILCVSTLFVGLTLSQGFDFHFAKLVPGLSVASALNGLRLARKAYNAGKTLRRSLKLVTGWTGISLVISVLGDAAVGYLLENQLNTLANW